MAAPTPCHQRSCHKCWSLASLSLGFHNFHSFGRRCHWLALWRGAGPGWIVGMDCVGRRGGRSKHFAARIRCGELGKGGEGIREVGGCSWSVGWCTQLQPMQNNVKLPNYCMCVCRGGGWGWGRYHWWRGVMVSLGCRVSLSQLCMGWGVVASLMM